VTATRGGSIKVKVSQTTLSQKTEDMRKVTSPLSPIYYKSIFLTLSGEKIGLTSVARKIRSITLCYQPRLNEHCSFRRKNNVSYSIEVRGAIQVILSFCCYKRKERKGQ
jgi:hypothetical protein